MSSDPERIAHFRIVGRLGQGGMGIVYRAEDERLRRTVALKMLPDALAQDEERRRRFLREARSAAALTHANIATVYEVDEDGGRVFLVMEIVEGESLRQRIARGRIPLGETVRIARELTRGLARAHAKGIVHRDLKPDNVVLDADGTPKILDFGLAKLREAEASHGATALEHAETASVVTEEGRTLGTPQYMSPEQARGDMVDGRSDLFSLGVMLYEMFSGRRPFAGSSSAEILASILRDTPTPLGEIAPEVPAEVEVIVMKCLARSPADRWSSGGELLEALEAIATSGSVKSEMGVTSASRPSSRRRRWVAAVFVAAGVAGTVAWGLLSRGPPISSASTPSSSGASASPIHAITEWPAPKTSSAEAATLYAEALQATRNATGLQWGLLKRAVELDPHFAAAHLRLELGHGTLSDDRDHLAAAEQSRALLDERDQGLLTFEETCRRSDATHVVEVARAFGRGSPHDPEMQAAAAVELDIAGSSAEATQLLSEAIRLDPRFAGALSDRARTEWLQGDIDGMLRDADDCLAVAPGAASCLGQRALADSLKGDCDRLGSDARALVALQPAWGNYRYLQTSLEAKGAAASTLVELTHHAEATVSDDKARPRLILDDAVRVAIDGGDFVAAEARLHQLRDEMARESDEAFQFPSADLMALYVEQGDAPKAITVAQDYLNKVPAWVHAEPAIWDYIFDTTVGRFVALRILRHARLIPDERVRELRESWINEWFKGATPARRGYAWIWFYAYPADTEQDAHDALDALRSFEPLPPDTTLPNHAGARGRVCALAGDMNTAIPLLRAAVRPCGECSEGARFPGGMWWMATTMQNRLLLGEALEEKGDTPGACEQYAAILERWGRAKPRSVTADEARARSQALGCR